MGWVGRSRGSVAAGGWVGGWVGRSVDYLIGDQMCDDVLLLLLQHGRSEHGAGGSAC